MHQLFIHGHRSTKHSVKLFIRNLFLVHRNCNMLKSTENLKSTVTMWTLTQMNTDLLPF